MTSHRGMTRQQQAVAVALEQTQSFCSAQELYTRMRASGARIGLTTIYRGLAALTEAGEVDAVRSDDGEVVYRRCAHGHHHHLICRRCGRTVEVEGPSVERWATKVATEAGYVDVTHTVEVFGTCGTCVAAMAGRATG